jgi:hypothetical protein
MCARCETINVTLTHYRELASFIMDRPTLDSIDILTARLEAEKKALHSKAQRPLS